MVTLAVFASDTRIDPFPPSGYCHDYETLLLQTVDIFLIESGDCPSSL